MIGNNFEQLTMEHFVPQSFVPQIFTLKPEIASFASVGGLSEIPITFGYKSPTRDDTKDQISESEKNECHWCWKPIGQYDNSAPGPKYEYEYERGVQKKRKLHRGYRKPSMRQFEHPKSQHSGIDMNDPTNMVPICCDCHTYRTIVKGDYLTISYDGEKEAIIYITLLLEGRFEEAAELEKILCYVPWKGWQKKPWNGEKDGIEFC